MPLSTNDVLRMIDKRWFLPFAIAVMCVLVIILPLAVGGLHASGDLTVYLSFAQEFRASFGSGDLFPSWTIDNLGYGSVGLRFYPPMAAFLTAVIQLVIRDWYYSIWVYFIIWQVVGCCGMYLLVSRFSNKRLGKIAAILYAVIPFPVAEIYQYSLYAEFAAGAIIPFCFYFTARILSERNWSNVIGLMVSLSALVLSHIPSTLIAGIGLVLFVILLVGRQFTARSILQLAIAVAAALCATAFYWVTLVSEIQWLKHNQEKYSTGMAGYQQWLFPNMMGAASVPGYMVPVFRNLDAIIILTMGFVIPYLIVIVIDRKFIRRDNARLHLAMAVVGLFGFFMSSRLSSWIWAQFDVLQKIQFPWRWMTLSSVMCAALFILTFTNARKSFGKYRYFLTLFVVGLVSLVIVYDVRQSFGKLNTISRTEFQEALDIGYNPVGTSFEAWWPVWAKGDALKVADRVVAGGREYSVESWERDRRVFDIEPGPQNEARIATFYYPFWRAEVNGQQVEITPDDNGVITLPVGPEHEHVDLHFNEPAKNRAAVWLSGFTWTLLILLLAIGLIKNRARMARNAGVTQW